MFALLVALALIGCTGGGQNDPKTVMQEAFQKAKGLNSLEATYDFVMRVSGGEKEISMNGVMKTYQKGTNARIDMALEGNFEGAEALKGIEMQMYVKDKNQYVCMRGGMTGSSWTCMGYATATETPTVEKYGELAKKMLDSGALSFEGGVQSRTVAGRACNEITAKIDFSKIDLREFGMSYAGIDDETMAKATEIVKEARMKECFDSGTGAVLSMEINWVMDLSKIEGSKQAGEMTIRMSMSATEFKPNADVQDSMFELPAEPTGYT